MSESHLWRAVIAQAFVDAATCWAMPDIKSPYPYTTMRAEAMRDAREWLTSHSADFQTVCTWAGLDVGSTIEKARQLESKGWPYRGPRPRNRPGDWGR